MTDAFVPEGRFTIAGRAGGPLAGLTFAAKDLYDVAGYPTGFGNPTWLATHPVPTRHSPAVAMLLDAGATLIGKTITDELAYSMNGDNVHYGTPLNPRAPDRVPGGSSSGSASAVARGDCDFALGSDTGGSVRVPSSFCAIWGLRTTHGAIPLTGVAPLMPSYDTVGWMARDPAVLLRVGEVLVPPSTHGFRRALLLEDACELADAPMRPLVDRVVRALGEVLAPPQPLRIAPEGLEAWRLTYLNASAHEGWQVHGAWITQAQPRFGPAVAQRFKYASEVSDAVAAGARADRARHAARVREVLGDDGVAVLPSAAGHAPLKTATGADVDAFRMRTMRITCIAGHAGLPQVNIPFLDADGIPLGVSLLGPAGSDLALIRLAQAVGARAASL